MTAGRVYPRFLVAAVFVGGCLLPGCKHVPPPAPALNPQGSSSFRMIEPPGKPGSGGGGVGETAQIRKVFVPAEPYLPLALPVYPPAALAARSAGATVSVHVVVDSRGRVAEITPSSLGFTTPGP